jgi:hypothetical protein
VPLSRVLRRPQNDLATTLKKAKLISEVKKSLINGLVGAMLGVSGLVGFWLSPLKAIVMHSIWKESADLTVHTSQRTLRVGDQMEVTVEAVPASPIPVSEGVLQILSSDDGLVRKGGVTESATPEIAAPMILPKGERLILQAVGRGRFTVTATLKTKFGAYKAQTSIDVNPINQPTRDNLSGEWNLRMGSVLGKMELIHRGADVSGIYKLAHPEIRGTIAGFVDGKTFNVEMVNQGETRRKWFVSALYIQGDGFVEIKDGTIKRQILESNEWTDVGRAEVFYASSIPAR